jgi:hypothetical protein
VVDGREIQIQMSNKSRGKTNQDHEQTVNVLAHKCQKKILLKITGIIISVSKAELIKASINIIEAPAKYDNLSLTEKKKMNEIQKIKVQRTNPHLKTPKEANKIEMNRDNNSISSIKKHRKRPYRKE